MIESSAAFACPTVTPGFKRPIMKRLSLSRDSSQLFPGSISFAIIIGAQNAGAYATSVPTNPLGATPTTLKV